MDVDRVVLLGSPIAVSPMCDLDAMPTVDRIVLLWRSFRSVELTILMIHAQLTSNPSNIFNRCYAEGHVDTRATD